MRRSLDNFDSIRSGDTRVKTSYWFHWGHRDLAGRLPTSSLHMRVDMWNLSTSPSDQSGSRAGRGQNFSRGLVLWDLGSETRTKDLQANRLPTNEASQRQLTTFEQRGAVICLVVPTSTQHFTVSPVDVELVIRADSMQILTSIKQKNICIKLIRWLLLLLFA